VTSILGTRFYFNSEDCETYSVSIVNFENTEWRHTSGGNGEYTKDKTKRSTEYLLLDYDENAVLTFTLELVCERDYTSEDIHTLKEWLFGIFGYKKLSIQTDELSGYYFNCILKPNQDYIINGKFVGISFDVECDSPYAWQDIVKHIVPTTNPYTYNLNNISGTINNTLPTVEFVLKGTNKNLSIKNVSNNNIDFKWTGLNTTEKIVCDCKNGIIQSYLWATSPEPAHYDLNSVSRLSCFNKTFLRLVKGNNQLIISGTDGVTDIADYIDIKYKRAVRLGGGIL
jgi:hypothetical protein